MVSRNSQSQQPALLSYCPSVSQAAGQRLFLHLNTELVIQCLMNLSWPLVSACVADIVVVLDPLLGAFAPPILPRSQRHHGRLNCCCDGDAWLLGWLAYCDAAVRMGLLH